MSLKQPGTEPSKAIVLTSKGLLWKSCKVVRHGQPPQLAQSKFKKIASASVLYTKTYYINRWKVVGEVD